MHKILNLSSFQKFKFALYSAGKDVETVAKEIGTTKNALRVRIYAGLKRKDGKRTPLDEKIIDYIKSKGIDYNVS